MALRQIYTISQITNRLINRMTSVSSITDYTPGSNIRTIFETVSIFVEYLQFLIEETYRSFFIDTASLGDLDARVNDFGMQRKASRFSTGIITLQRNTAATSTFTVFSETQVSTEPDVFGNTIPFSLDNDVTFVSGAVSATGAITCLIPGIEGNVSSGKITNITSAIPGVDAVINYLPTTDGSTEESDEQLRARVPLFINGLKRGNEDAIRSAILSIDGITIVGLKENSPINGYITVYVSNESGQLSQSQIDQVKEAAESAAAFGIQTNVVTPFVEYIKIELSAEIDSEYYDINIVNADIKNSIDQFIRTNPESEVQMYDLIIAATVPGVKNIKDVKINGTEEDYSGVGDFVVVRLQDKDIDITINNIVDIIVS